MKRTRIDCKGRTPEPVPAGQLQSLYPGLDAAFSQLALGESLNVLQMMAAISDLVAFTTEGDTKSSCSNRYDNFMSQKKCRFCD